MRLLMTLIAGALACSAAEPLSDFNRVMYGQTKIWILQSAEKMPEENYGFRPTDAVRNFGAIIGHVADVQYRFCSLALGEEPGQQYRAQQIGEGRSDRRAERVVRILRPRLRSYD